MALQLLSHCCLTPVLRPLAYCNFLPSITAFESRFHNWQRHLTVGLRYDSHLKPQLLCFILWTFPVTGFMTHYCELIFWQMKLFLRFTGSEF